MSLSGLLLIIFLLGHLIINFMLLFGQQAYNSAAFFLEENAFMRILEPLLGLGFIVHILYSVVVTVQNRKETSFNNSLQPTSWSSRNMFVLGGLILIFLVIHLMNFSFRMELGGISTLNYNGQEVKDVYSLVTSLFRRWYYTMFYVMGMIFLGMHLNHAIKSALQTMGVNNKRWAHLVSNIGTAYSVLISVGYGIIPLYFLVLEYL